MVLSMPTEYDEDVAQLAAQIALCQNMLTKVAVMAAQLQEKMGAPMSGTGKKVSNIRSLQRWVDYLAQHGPSLRQDIWDATGTNLSQAAQNITRQWHGPMTFWPENSVGPDTLMSIQSLGTGKGRPPVIYFLWSQRFDVHPKFGVGPEKPTETDRGFNFASDEFSDATWTEGTLLGVIEPPKFGFSSDSDTGVSVWPEPTGPTIWDGLPEEAEEGDGRFATVREWYDHHAALFSLVRNGHKATPEEKQVLKDTAPDGIDVLAAMALAATGQLDKLFDMG